MKPIEILLLSQADLIQLDLSPDDELGAVEQAVMDCAYLTRLRTAAVSGTGAGATLSQRNLP